MSEERRRLFEALRRKRAQEAAAGSPPKEEAKPRTAVVVAMKPTGTRPPFFCIHAITGSAFPYHKLALHLPAEQPLYGVQSRGLDGKEEPLRRVEEMAAAYVEAIRAVQPHGPYHLGGYSFGGWVAYEMARRLLAEGEPIGVLAMFGTGAPPTTLNPSFFGSADAALKDLEERRRTPGAEAPASPAQAQVPPDPEAGLSPLQRVLAVNARAMWRYVARPYAGGLDVFLTPEQQLVYPSDLSMGWRPFCAAVSTHLVDGNHLNMFEEPHVRSLAAALTGCLERKSVHA
jgi:thioesterase domain-containing protein